MAWDEKRIREFLATTKLEEYQRIPLPFGLEIPGFDKSRAAEEILRDTVRGKRVLDVGSNYGYFSFEAKARGAASVTGIDHNPEHVSVARTLAEIRGVDVEFRADSLESCRFDAPFDVVLLLNVIHHLPDPVAGVCRAAELAKELVVAEFPTPEDRKWRRREGVGWLRRLALRGLPVVGVSSQREDARYLYSPGAFRAAFTIHAPVFKSVEVRESDWLEGRAIAFCAK